MTASYLIGLDYGTELARGVLVDIGSGEQVESRTHPYRHGVMARALAGGRPLLRGWALQDAADYLEAAEDLLSALGRGRQVEGIGVGFTASSPLPALADGTPLSSRHPDEPHAYVKLWKHASAQRYADAINRGGGRFLDNFGGKLSGEWLLAKAAQLKEEAPALWDETARFIEAGDWLVWRLTGEERRSLGFAAYKAQYAEGEGYPAAAVPGLASRLAEPVRIGSPAGALSEAWRARTGIEGRAVVATAVIDSHVVLPAVGAVAAGCFVGALGTSAVYLYLGDSHHPLPPGIEGVARDGSLPDLWCYEAGQAGFGDTLSWFVTSFPRGADIAESFRRYNQEAAALRPGANHLVALDWWSGNRVPLADFSLSGLLLGLSTATSAVDIYRALLESLCFGARSVADLFEKGGLPIRQVVLTSGLAQNNPLLVQLMADVLDRAIDVPEIDNATAVGAAIHGAVSAGTVASFAEGAHRFGARRSIAYRPREAHAATYRTLYRTYRSLAGNVLLRDAMHDLNRASAATAESVAAKAVVSFGTELLEKMSK